MTDNQRIEALKVVERHLTMNRQERRKAGISTPRRIIEAARDELLPYVEGQTEHRMSTAEALPPRTRYSLEMEDVAPH